MGASDELRSILLEAKLDTVSAEGVDTMLRYIESELPSLHKLRLWWNDLKGFIDITSVGSALAYANAKRMDPLEGLPTLAELIDAS